MSRSVSDVSIVTVNWNGREHLEQLLPSLTPLSAAEIIVVDNGSSDGSQDFLARRYPTVRVLQNATNRGFAQPNNLAAQRAKGRYLALVNNDMRADPDWLSAALDRMSDKVVCVGSRILDWEGRKVDFNGGSLQYLGYAQQRDIGALAEGLGHDDRVLFACGGAMLIDRAVFQRVGGFDEDFFAIYEDVDLGWRLWQAGYEVAFAPDSMVFHKGHGTFKAHDQEKMRYLMHRNALLTVLKNYEEAAFRRILPLAVVLTIKRAVRFSGVERERFYLWSRAEKRLAAPDAAARFQIIDALNQLVALDDVLTDLPRLLDKRARTQSLRARPDADIFALFADPFRRIVDDAEYLDVERDYLEALDLTRLFEPLARPPQRPDLAPELRDRIDALRQELRGLEWRQAHAALHPPAGEAAAPGLWRRLWRKRGLSAAWRRFRELVDRGI
jgi:GT2 family glycosyltransferase